MPNYYFPATVSYRMPQVFALLAQSRYRRFLDDENTRGSTTINAFEQHVTAYVRMSSFIEQPLFEREIAIPAKLPMILKQFCKAAIRTQPHDLLKWSGSYFRALADGEEPPVKSRLEYPPPSTASGLTLGFLRVLLRQFGSTIREFHARRVQNNFIYRIFF